MASTFILKRKTFADNMQNPQMQGQPEQKKSGFGKKLLAGAGALAATAAVGYSASKGKLGVGAQRTVNTALSNVGNKFSNMNNGVLQNMGKKIGNYAVNNMPAAPQQAQ